MIEFCYWSFHSQFQLKWQHLSAIFSSNLLIFWSAGHGLQILLIMNHFKCKISPENTKLLTIFSVFVKFRDHLTVLTNMKSCLSKTLKPILFTSIKFGIGSLHLSYVHYILVRTSSAEPLLYVWSYL